MGPLPWPFTTLLSCSLLPREMGPVPHAVVGHRADRSVSQPTGRRRVLSEQQAASVGAAVAYWGADSAATAVEHHRPIGREGAVGSACPGWGERRMLCPPHDAAPTAHPTLLDAVPTAGHCVHRRIVLVHETRRCLPMPRPSSSEKPASGSAHAPHLAFEGLSVTPGNERDGGSQPVLLGGPELNPRKQSLSFLLRGCQQGPDPAFSRAELPAGRAWPARTCCWVKVARLSAEHCRLFALAQAELSSLYLIIQQIPRRLPV
ncbi:uncharacterized protein LOC116660178 [Camelus ferus]|uniref:Uncharacterized protein LOC116660178 n=1 Tax=Camelus ferus TaxID=419612 RepID=A0A8B8S4V9_CAMFR|nr:uncharacterized protein LOC116660178 [Camelus ferus]